MPAYNEAANIVSVIYEIQSLSLAVELHVVDGAPRIAQRLWRAGSGHGLETVCYPGYGAAV
jgi:hypothetical protein